MEKAGWYCALELSDSRQRVAGTTEALAKAIRRGADLRVGTGFRHNEHIDITSTSNELIHEFVDFRVTYLLENHWTAGICNLRMPVELPGGFGPRESMSFFLYNEDGVQAIARPFLDGKSPAETADSPLGDYSRVTKFHELHQADLNTNVPIRNFIYDFDFFRFCVNDRWREVLSQSADGMVLQGSIDELVSAFNTGAELKVAIRGLCDDLADGGNAIDHEVFVHLGSCYYYTEQELFIGACHPVVRVVPAIPLVYSSHNWDFGWMVVRTDGHVGGGCAILTR